MKIGSPLSAGARKLLVRTFCLIAIGCVGNNVLVAQTASSYFASAYGLSGTTLKTQLEGIIDGHTTLSYTPGIWSAHKDLYEDPNNSNHLILFYSQVSFAKSAQDPGSGSEQYWNREHLWPRSYGVGTSGSDNTDLFSLVPANKAVNNDRSNNYFDYADPNVFGYEDPAYHLAPECKENGSLVWEPGDAQKGWVARAMLYMTTRYSYLQLVDTPPDAAPNTSSSRMAQLSVMLEWNRKFLPAAKELDVNQRIFDNYQHNRNPYIDFPEFADAVFVSGPSWGAWRLEHFTLVELLNPTISGDLADPDMDGLSNLMEMARYSDPRLQDSIPAISYSYENAVLSLSFIRAEDVSNLNLNLVLEGSSNLVDWSPVDLSTATTSSLGDDTEQVSLDISTSTEYFYRLSAGRP